MTAAAFKTFTIDAATQATTTISVGAILWLSVRPLIRLSICVLCGILLTKKSLLPASAARTIGIILLNLCYPCLLFSKIVPAFNATNIHYIGPLALVAVLYHLIGITMAWMIKQVCWVPYRFRYGFLAAGAWSNIGDIPTAVLLGLTSSAPFNSATDPNASIAYLSVFIIVFNITIFPCGGHKLVEKDFTSPDPDTERDREITNLKRIFRTLRGSFPFHFRFRSRGPEKAPLDSEPNQPHDDEKGSMPCSKIDSHKSCQDAESHPITANIDSQAAPVISAAEITEIDQNDISPSSPTRADSPTPTIIDVIDPKRSKGKDAESPHVSSKNTHFLLLHITKFTQFLTPLIRSLLSPPSLSILIAIPISLILPLKALFLPLPPDQQSHVIMPTLPDGQPPLSFILDATQFIGASAVPLGLMCLGSALARLQLPAARPTLSPTPTRQKLRRRLSSLPITSITLLAISKLVLAPIFGMLIVQALVSRNIISKEDKVLRLVCLFCACLPTSTTQVYLTQVYSGTGGVQRTQWLAAYLVPQYALMVLTMTVYTGLVLKVLFG